MEDELEGDSEMIIERLRLLTDFVKGLMEESSWSGRLNNMIKTDRGRYAQFDYVSLEGIDYGVFVRLPPSDGVYIYDKAYPSLSVHLPSPSALRIEEAVGKEWN
jgi:hypothetical protein